MLDPLDRRLLAVLHDDARASYRALARAVGTTAPTAIARLRRLKELGILRGYRPVLAPPAGHVYECVTSGIEPPAVILERVHYGDGTRWSCLVDDPPAFQRWATGQGVTIHAVESVHRPRHRADPQLACHECRGPLPDRPIEAIIAGRHHAFCCTTCRDHMGNRAARLDASHRAAATPPSTRP